MTKPSNEPATFRLIVKIDRADEPPAPTGQFVQILGDAWTLQEFERLSDTPPFTCISYSWGEGTTANAFKNAPPMSDRAMPVLEAAIKATRSAEPKAIWIDALCMPPANPAREECLRSMGAIYSRAGRVVVILPTGCARALQKIRDKQPMDGLDLLALEHDDWSTRAWTYQELANSKGTFFAAEGCDALINETDFLHAIAMDLPEHTDAAGIERSKINTAFPRLDSLLAMLPALQLAGYLGRSVYQVMVDMHPRSAKFEGDRVYAMIGTITDVEAKDQFASPGEYLMNVCEEKKDFSFIYCTAPRCDLPGAAWRPLTDKFTPVLPGIPTIGSGLSGHKEKTHLHLKNMRRLAAGPINPKALSAVGSFIQKDLSRLSLDETAAAALEYLRIKGFSGHGDYIELTNGYFFPQSELKFSDDMFVIASEDVHWGNGGPGLLVRSSDKDINQFCDVGVFIGQFPETIEPINIG